jgi:hypothetical protein
MKQTFHIPDEFRVLMRDVTSQLDWEDDPTTLIGPDAINTECGRGGRVEGTDVYRFVYFAKDGHNRWEIELREQQIRDIAAGNLSEIDALELEPNTQTKAHGEPLLVWGEYDDDALRVRTLGDLEVALDALYTIGVQVPCLIRLWAPNDAQIVAVLNGADSALYVVCAEQGYGTSVGDPTRQGTFELTDHDVGAVAVPWADCVPWRVGRAALLAFAETGHIGEGVILDGSIPSQLMMLGDFDRATELQTRRPAPVDPARSSLPEKTPASQWAQRLITALVELQLIEIDMSIPDAIRARVTMLLTSSGHDAMDSVDSANQLAKQIEKVRGVGALFATGGDLQIALRRTQDPPTNPVEIPIS